MKITKNYLKQIILEEISFLIENNPFEEKSEEELLGIIEDNIKNIKTHIEDYSAIEFDSTKENFFNELEHIESEVLRQKFSKIIDNVANLTNLLNQLMLINGSPDGNFNLIEQAIQSIKFSAAALANKR